MKTLCRRLGVTDNLPNQIVRVRKTKDCNRKVTIFIGVVNGKTGVNPIKALLLIGRATKELDHASFVLTDKQIVKLIGRKESFACLKIYVLSE